MSFQQYRTLLVKDFLIRKARLRSTLSEIFCPVFFILLLVLFKSISTAYDSSNIAYYCGQTFPWFYAETTDDLSTTLEQCVTKNCDVKNYYRGATTYYSYDDDNSEKIYTEYGYIDSGINYPFYGLTVGDEADIYQVSPYWLYNPSLPAADIIRRLYAHGTILALSPDNQVVKDFKDFLISDYIERRDTIQSDDYTVTDDFTDDQTFWEQANSTIRIFESEKAINDYVKDHNYDDIDYKDGKVSMGIIFNSIDTTTQQWDYSIRLNYTYSWEQDETVPCLYYCDFTYTIPTTEINVEPLIKPYDSDFYYGYTYSGFVALQKITDQFILTVGSLNGQTNDIYDQSIKLIPSLGMFPTEDFKSDDFQYIISGVLGLFYMLSYLYPVSRIIRGLVLEKELKIKEGMYIMGLSRFIHAFGWFSVLIFQQLISIGLIILIAGSTVFEYSNNTIIFLWFLLFSAAVINLCYMVSNFFDRSKTASTLGTIFFFATFFPYFALSDDSYSTSTKTWSCLLAPTCFALGADVIADYEGGLVGLHWDNISEKTGNFSMTLCLIMLFVDFLIYGILSWYFSKVLPSEFGTHLKPWFFLTSEYWFPPKTNFSINNINKPLLNNTMRESEYNENHFEPVEHELKRQEDENRCVIIRGLRRVFQTTSEDRIAVKGLNLEFYEGQITVLLGHNGAGKSTTINMITGMIPVTSGEAFILGEKITEKMPEIRKTLGVCPQHDILYPELTCEQHLRMFANFKGMKTNEIEREIDDMIAQVGLIEKRKVKTKMLSGGMKRKLSLAIALIGGSKVVILDEPTSGMDPFSRRSTWNILQKNKKDRVILLTTHFMDEADILGDRIAIMAEGELKCCGSSLFLKNLYGVGYTLTIVKNNQGNKNLNIENLIKKHIPESESLSIVGAEESYRLPFSSSSKLAKLFEEFDNNLNNLSISTYGISVTTLEEVFLRVGHGTEDLHVNNELNEITERLSEISRKSALEIKTDNDDDENNNNINSINNNDEFGEDNHSLNRFYSKKKGRESELLVFRAHLTALLRKRMIYAARDTRAIVCQLVIPTILILFGLIILILSPDLGQPDLILSPKHYNTDYDKNQRNYVPFQSFSETGDEIQSRFNNNNIYGQYVEITDENDQFDTCAQGAIDLFEMSNYLLSEDVDLTNEDGSSRYGAITIANSTDENNLVYNALVNISSLHAPGIYMNLVHTASLQVLSGIDDAMITIHNYPLPRTYQQEQQSKTGDAFTASLMIMIAMSFLPASFAIFVVREKEVKAKHQQIISGVSIYAYWTSTLLWDTISNLITSSISIILIFAFSIDSFTKGYGSGIICLLFFLFGPAVASFTYMLSYLFKSHSTAQNVILFLNFLTGLCLMMTSFVLDLIDSTRDLNASLKYLWRLFPGFCLGDGLLQLSICDDGRDCPTLGDNGYDVNNTHNPYYWDVCGADILFLFLEIFVYFGITVFIEYMLSFPSFLAFLQSVNDPGTKDVILDEDVQLEQDRINNNDVDNDIITLHNLRKVFPTPIGPKIAVQGLSFGVHKGECFGFLGINGAGKTTTLSILSGEFPPTIGTAKIAGFDIHKDQRKIRRKIGYCPQFDALLELLTVKEHLELYARIKGIPRDLIKNTVDYKIKEMDLSDFRNKAAGSLSGGNKRKLSVAIAMIGEPKIVFLDEPSTGMDPISRRFMWEVISRLSTQGSRCSIILTTHSMEEAEALCTRIGIMVNGQLRCLGSSQHLKHRFGNGYEVDFKLSHLHDEEVREIYDIFESNNLELRKNNMEDISSHNNPLINNDDIDESKFNDIEKNYNFGENIYLSDDLQSYCEALGDAERMNEICPTGSGLILYQTINSKSSVTLRHFAEWWFADSRAIALNKFMNDTFTGMQLLERPTLFSFRYRIPELNMSLSHIFSEFEKNKKKLNINEYSVGQTTLEQIFNHFASSQENPEVNLT